MTNKPKLSILTIDYGAGGTERVISLLLPELQKDFEVTLVIFYNYVDYDIPEGVKLLVLKPETKKTKSFFFKIKNFASLFVMYKTFIKDEDISVSISFLPIPNIINSCVRLTRKRLRTIISERCYPSIMYTESKVTMMLAKLFFPLFYNRSNVLFSNSIYINQDLKENFGVKIPMEVIYNPIHTDDALKLNAASITQTDLLKIINVGQLYSAKNQQLIIEALQHSEEKNIHLTILGTGQLKTDLQAQADALGLTKNVTLEGKVSDVKSYLLKNDCFVLSSNTEGFPNVLLEALSVGLPSISTNCMSGPLELLNENKVVTINKGDFYKAKYGILVNTNDSVGLYKAISYLKEHPKERQRYSKLGFERAKDYDITKIYNQLKGIINT